jgi:hypothetical protein
MPKRAPLDVEPRGSSRVSKDTPIDQQARTYSKKALSQLWRLAWTSKNEQVSLLACRELLTWAHGKPWTAKEGKAEPNAALAVAPADDRDERRIEAARQVREAQEARRRVAMRIAASGPTPPDLAPRLVS